MAITRSSLFMSLLAVFLWAGDLKAEATCPRSCYGRQRQEIRSLIWREGRGVWSILVRMHDLGLMARVGGYSLYQREAINQEFKALSEIVEAIGEGTFSGPEGDTSNMNARSRRCFEELIGATAVRFTDQSLVGATLTVANTNAEKVIDQTSQAIQTLGACPE